jgi:hypothetical protein
MLPVLKGLCMFGDLDIPPRVDGPEIRGSASLSYATSISWSESPVPLDELPLPAHSFSS